MSESTFERHFGPPPRRPAKGELLQLPGHDVAQVGVLAPHPVYAWMRWVQILAPTAERVDAIRPLPAGSLGLVRDRWRRRVA